VVFFFSLACDAFKVYYFSKMTRAKSHNGSGSKRLLAITMLSLLVFLVIAGLIYWQREPLLSWMTLTTTGIFQLFGWGLALVAVMVFIIIEVSFTRPILFLRSWNKWIGGFIILAAIWGLLSFFYDNGLLKNNSLGGNIGLRIIGPHVIGGIFIIIGLIILALFFIIPRGFAHFIAICFSWIFRRRKREPDAQAMPVPAPSTSSKVAYKQAESDVDLKPTVFPKYNPEPRKKPAGPVYGSKNWLWKRLHPEAEPQPPVPTAISGPEGIKEGVLTDQVSEDVKEPETSAAESKTSTVDSGGSETEVAASESTGIKKEGSAAAAKGVANPRDVKLAAQEVWKKYGEAASQATSDGWKLPPLEILDNMPEVEFSPADNVKKAKMIEDALASYGVEGKVVQINVGPTVTQFGIEPGWDRKLKEIKEKDKNGDVQVKIEEVAKTRVKVDRITSLANDLSLALAAPSIRIEAPVPGKSVVGIEVPNTTIGTVSLRSVMESNVFQKMQAKAKLTMALGKGAGGESVVGDMTKMPHLLIAGATGSGKTVCIHSIICCLLLYNTPNDVRFIMIDPKRVELTSYNSLPHLATPVIVDTQKALGALRWLAGEMDKRYQTLAAARARNIEAYNKARPNEKLPYLVLIIDELADLMMTSGEEVEQNLCRLAQLARATGIHLIVATQRPSVDVVTGLIKANFPSRISFAVTSQVDSRTILDSSGAEKLLGRGDMLYAPTEAAKPKRLQGCFVSDPETERLVYFWNNQKKDTAYQLRMEDMSAEVAKAEKPPDDPLLEEGRKLLQQHKHISASFLQRHLRIGYPRAARLMEQLEEEMGEGIAELEDITEEEEGKQK
jgi:DNA segregation ATPase FtsK/SpoIIIE, S-DNA-T family